MDWTRDPADVRGKWTTPEGWRVYTMADGSFRVYDPLGGYRIGDSRWVVQQYAEEMQATR